MNAIDTRALAERLRPIMDEIAGNQEGPPLARYGGCGVRGGSGREDLHVRVRYRAADGGPSS